jgi:hypothetical protein
VNRQVPATLAAQFRQSVNDAIDLAQIGETAKAEALRTSQTFRNLHPVRLEALYELAYLRIFVSWEVFIEEAFLRYLCGYHSSRGITPTLIQGVSFSTSLATAEARILGNQAYVLWHNPQRVVARASTYFQISEIGTTVASYQADLENLAAVRHRISHGQDDARNKFDAATIALAAKRYRGSRPGAFLRDFASHAPPVRWLEKLGNDLIAVAGQIV